VSQRQRRAEHLAQVGRVQGMCPADAGVWPLYARGAARWAILWRR